MAFNRESLKRSIRSLGASAVRQLGERIARAFGTRRPRTTAEARRTVESAGTAPPPVRSPFPGSGGGSGYRSPPPPPDPLTRVVGPEPPRPGEESFYGPEILTPASTNVYSFSYVREGGQRLGTLYVTFKAHTVNPVGVTHGVEAGTGRRKASRKQLLGKRGQTVGGKTGGRGAMYAYYKVPPSVYTKLLAVKGAGNQQGPGVKSPGTGVWDMLRVRGTVWGHKYQYGLVQGQVTPQVGGVYIPRKATKGGFRSRGVAEAGSGARGFQTSTLPQQNGFSTRRR